MNPWPQTLQLHQCPAGNLQIPQEALYKKNVLITRGRFRPFTLLHNDMLMGAASQFFCDPDGTGVLSSQDMSGESGDAYTECVYRDDTLVLLELTTRDMMEVHTASVSANTQLPLAHMAACLPCTQVMRRNV